MVGCEVGEYADFELKSGYPFLLHPDRAHFHEAVSASGICHLGEEGIDGDWVRGGVDRLVSLASYIVRYGGEQSAAVAQTGEHVVEQRHCGGLAVRAGYSHEGELFGRPSVEVGRHYREGVS